MWEEDILYSDFKAATYNEFDDYFGLVSDNVIDAANNNVDYASILESDNEIDLFAIEATNLLGYIKSEITSRINKELVKEKTDKIDAEFKKSLRELLIVNNKKITADYLKRLSYVYYAIYNNTLPIYHNLVNKKRYIDYFMLEEKFYNSINNVIAFENYGENTDNQFYLAYKNNCEDEFSSILSINPNFYLHVYDFKESLDISKFFSSGWFKKIYDAIGPEVIANSNTSSNFSILREMLLGTNLEYAKELVSLNPNIVFDEKSIFAANLSLVTVFKMSQIAFFTKENKGVIKKIFERGEFPDTEIKIFNYYKELIDLKPEFTMIDKNKEISGIDYCLTKNIDFPPSIYVKLTDEERGKWIELIEKIRTSILPLASMYKVHSLINKLIKQYQEPTQKKLTK